MAEVINKEPDITPEEAQPPSRGNQRWLWITFALMFLLGVIILLGVLEDTIDVKQVKTPPPLQLVSIETINTTNEIANISAFSEIRPRWLIDMRASVSGRIKKVHREAFSGAKVKKGQTLIEIENSRYIAELAAANLALKETELALWKAQNATIIARREFQRFDRKPPNKLALKIPQLEIAKSSVASAKARVAAARQQLSETTIKAPFAGFVTERFVSPGQSVNAGDPLLKLVDNTAFELTIELSRSSWNLLKKPLSGQHAEIISQSGKILAQAQVRQGGGFLDEKTRQYKVFLEITKTGAQNVLSGDFVRVLLKGVEIPSALNIPASALTQEGYVWYLNKDNRLQRMTARVLFRRQGRVVLKSPTDTKNWRIIVTPLISFLPGQKVRPNTSLKTTKNEG